MVPLGPFQFAKGSEMGRLEGGVGAFSVCRVRENLPLTPSPPEQLPKGTREPGFEPGHPWNFLSVKFAKGNFL